MMRALLVFAGLAPAGAFSTFNEQTETRGYYQSNNGGLVIMGDSGASNIVDNGFPSHVPSPGACITEGSVLCDQCKSHGGSRSGFVNYLVAVTAGRTPEYTAESAGVAFDSYCMPEGTNNAFCWTQKNGKLGPCVPSLKLERNTYCSNRAPNGKSQYAENAAECAALVMKDPECGNGFSFYDAANSDRNTKYCDCPPPGENCKAATFFTYSTHIFTTYIYKAGDGEVCGA